MITVWNVLNEIRKNSILIICITLVFLTFSVVYSYSIKSWTAQIIIKYNPNTRGAYVLGNDMTVNPDEIKNPRCISHAIELSGLDTDTQSVIKSISISKISANTKDDETSDKYKDKNNTAKYCKVSITSPYGKEYASLMLNSVINSYFDFYADKCASAYMLNTVDLPSVEDYDYIEFADMIEERIDDALNYTEILNAPETFRSTSTGYTFDELKKLFMFIRDNELSEIYAEVEHNNLSKNGLIISQKYKAKSIEAKSQSEAKQLSADNAAAFINAHINSEANKPALLSGENAFTSDDTIFAKNVSEYVTNSIEAEELLFKSEEYAQTSETISNLNNNDKSAEQKLTEIASQTEELLSKLKDTSNDYQKYISTDIVQCITGISTYSGIKPILVYSLFVGFGVIISIISVVAKMFYKTNCQKQNLCK